MSGEPRVPNARLAAAAGDSAGAELAELVRPHAWRNSGQTRYSLVVIGGGSCGIATAVAARRLGVRVALVERHWLGGERLHHGDVPTAALLRCAHAAGALRRAPELGVIDLEPARIDYSVVRERVERARLGVAARQSARRLAQLGIDLHFGAARFTGRRTIEVDGRTLRFDRAVIAAGAYDPAAAIDGLEEVPALTMVNLFGLSHLPRLFGVIGAGPRGCEMAQAFARLGCEVFLVDVGHGVLPGEPPDAAESVRAALAADGVHLLCCAHDLTLTATEGGRTRLRLESHGESHDEIVDELLIVGERVPVTTELALEAAGIEYDPVLGIEVDEGLRTSNRAVLALGEVCASAPARRAGQGGGEMVVRNALFGGRAKLEHLASTWTIHTAPEIAHLGLRTDEARRRNIDVDTYRQDLAGLDRALVDGDEGGFVRVRVVKGSDRIVGATAVAPRAGELVAPLALAMTHRIGLAGLAECEPPYPSASSALRELGERYRAGRMAPTVRGLVARWLE